MSASGAVVADRKDTGKIVAWSLWDWGSAAYNAVIVTFVFSVYLVEGVGKDLPGDIRAASWLGWSSAAGAVVIGVPVGFVNVVEAKEELMNTAEHYIVNRGRKGGSNVAAAIVNAALYQLSAREE